MKKQLVLISKKKELAEYIMDQLSDLGGIRNIPMIGEYIFIIRNGYLVGFMEMVKEIYPELLERKSQKKKA